MYAQQIVEYGAPLQGLTHDTPQPAGTEVLIRVSHCGVCHSDVHLHDGYFGLGGDKKLDVTKGRELPFTLGHEIEGEVVAMGPEAAGVSIGQKVVVYPWIGCDECGTCKSGQENYCAKPRNLGVHKDGGFADHCLVPHPRFLLDFTGIPEGLAATYMCSGLTAYGALNKLEGIGEDAPVVIVGAGGVGMMGVQFCQAVFGVKPIVADVNPAARAKALEMGAAAVYDPAEEGALKQLVKDTGGGAQGSIDFVGNEKSLAFAQGVLRRGGKAVVVGLFGGEFRLPIPMFPMRAIAVQGSYVGSLQETRDMLELVKNGAVQPIPIETRALDDASKTLDDLRQGAIVGRVVLKP